MVYKEYTNIRLYCLSNKNLCLSKLNWTDIKLTEKVSVENEAWTKGWIDQKDEDKFSTNDYIKDFNWIETRSQNHLKK